MLHQDLKFSSSASTVTSASAALKVSAAALPAAEVVVLPMFLIVIAEVGVVVMLVPIVVPMVVPVVVPIIMPVIVPVGIVDMDPMVVDIIIAFMVHPVPFRPDKARGKKREEYARIVAAAVGIDHHNLRIWIIHVLLL